MRVINAYLNLLARRRWSALLALVIAALLLTPLLGDSLPVRAVGALLFVLILGGAVYTGRHTRRSARAMTVLLIVWLLLELTAALHPDLELPGLRLFVTLLVLGGAVWATFAELLGSHDSSVDGLLGTMFGYFLIAIAWSYLYVAIAVYDPDAFRLDQDIALGMDLRYFSLVTMTTLGYGDIVPVSPVARITAALQAAVGTLYVAIMIGRVVGSFVGRPRD
jgi:voltage-gated potassium channel